jgi:hypothetical protein
MPSVHVAGRPRSSIDGHPAPAIDVLGRLRIEDGGERDGHDGHEEAEDRQRRAPAEDDDQVRVHRVEDDGGVIGNR